MRRIGLLALAALACACGGENRPAGRTLQVGIWSNYMADDVVRAFEKEYDCRVETAWNYGSNDELLAKMQTKATGLDLVVPSDVILTVLISQGLLERVDLAKVPNFRHVDREFAGRAADPKNEWSVPYTWGTVGIAWRADKIAGEIDSWADFATDKAQGNAFLLEESRDGIAAALLSKGHDVNTIDAKELAEAKSVLLSWKPHLKNFTGEVKDTLLHGEAWMIEAYNGDVAQAMEVEKGKFKFAVPKEGGILWVDNFVIPKGAPSKGLALAFMDFILRPEIGARISNGIRYAVPNKDAFPLVKKEIREDPVIYAPPDVRKRLKQERDLGKDLPLYTELWSAVRAGG